ncbi:lipopolysaccharide biosynthesis protein [Cellulomonas sp. NPDC058312]|uniref:lipopolysaccharide biosynthesis protein n=1 Tax=Cellulomonas sp. NPDC058312 TaxID=3346441 RepID=UPI0036E209B8
MTGPVPDGDPAQASATRAVLGRGSLYTIATAGPALASLAVIPVVTRLVPVAEYDLVAVATVVVQVAFILVALGLGAAITRQYILDADGAAGARGVVIAGAVLASVVTAVLAATGPWWAPALLGRPFTTELLLALVAGAGGAWMVLSQSYLRGADRPGPFVALAIGASVVGPAAGLAAVAATERTAVVYLSGVVGGYLLAGAAGLVLVLRSGRPHLTRRGVVDALRVGAPTVPHQVSLYLALAGLVVIADRLLGDGGRANVALTIGAGATVVTAGLNNAWAPVVYRAAPADRGRVLDETSRVIALVAVVLAGGVALLAPWLVAVAAPAAYRPADLVPAVALACAAALPSVLYLASGHLVFARGRTAWLALSTPIAVGLGLAAAAGITAAAGLVGVGAGYLVAYLLLAVATTMVQRHVADRPWCPPSMLATVLLWVAATVAGALLPTAGTGALVRVGAAALLGVGGLLGVRRLGRRQSIR